MKLWLKRRQKGFTLVELMVVMAILAVLTTIVFTAVSGTSGISRDSQTRQDGSTVNTAIADYFSDQTGSEIVTTNTTMILTSTNVTDVAQKISSRWPEKYLAVVYLAEFPLYAATSGQAVSGNIIITDSNGTAITFKNLAQGWNAIDLTTLANGNYIPAIPNSSEELSDNFHNYLWLMKKTQTTAGGIATDSRKVEIFKLSKVEKNETTKNYTLTYEQIY